MEWEERREIEERGTVTALELQELIEDGDSGEIAEALLEGLKESLLRIGILAVDTTTDDDDGEYSFSLTRVEDEEEPRSVVT